MVHGHANIFPPSLTLVNVSRSIINTVQSISRLFIIVPLVLSHSSNVSSSFEAKLQREYSEIEKRLLTEDVASTEKFSAFLKTKGTQHASPNHPLNFVTFKSGLRAVFKKEDAQYRHYGEVAAYRVSKALGLGLVPPAVFRTVDGKLGSLQLYLDAPDLRRNTLKRKVYSMLDPKTISDSQIFNYVVGRLDSKGGNELGVLYEGKYTLGLIDNSTVRLRSYLQYGGPVFIYQGENLDKPSAEGIQFPYDSAVTVPGSQVEPLFKHYMSEKKARKHGKHRFISYVIWNHRLYTRYNRHSLTRFNNTIYQSTLEALQKLTYENMYEVWHEFYEICPEHAEDLIQLTLERRNEVLTFFRNNGVIVED